MRLSAVVGGLLAISVAATVAVIGTTVVLGRHEATVAAQLDTYRNDLQQLIAVQDTLARARAVSPDVYALVAATAERIGASYTEERERLAHARLNELRSAAAQFAARAALRAEPLPGVDTTAQLRLRTLAAITAIARLQEAATAEQAAAQGRLATVLLVAGLGLCLVLAVTGIAAHRLILRPIRRLAAAPDPERLLVARNRRRLPVVELEQILQRIVTLAAARREEDRRSRELVEQLPVGIVETAPDGRVLTANPAWRRLYGFGAEEDLTGVNVTALHTDPAVRARRVADLLAGRPVGRIEQPMRRRDGSTFWCEMHASAVADPAGGPIRIRGVHIDVSDRRQLEAQLHQSQKLEALGQLTGGIAHDFNNLLTVMLGSAETLADALGHDPELRSIAETAMQAAQRGAELTASLLAFARKQPLAPRPTDLNALLARTQSLLRRSLGEQIEIRLVLRDGVWPAMVDPAQLESAVLNLCVNARDAMPRGGRLTIETANVVFDAADAAREQEVAPGDYAMIAVSDTGIGMTPEVLARAVEPFFSTKEQGRGTGLGLSMVWGFVKQSRGHLRICSERGHGTTVTLYLPRVAADDQASATAPAAAPRGGSETILLVEDDPLVREHVAGQLGALGYRVLRAADGPEALALLEHERGIDLLFTDVVMPGGLNGRDLADLARARQPGLRVLFTSGYAEEAIVHHGRLDPDVLLLNKPYRRDELASRVRAALDGD
ncbi:ATP-binding protein [Elioraea sp.]|uniref:ATP-binding protein n=1 Tax=Elioraea sp. TaxID=2185103 RepID=UPI00307F2F8E